jgi:hypothetical protein
MRRSALVLILPVLGLVSAATLRPAIDGKIDRQSNAGPCAVFGGSGDTTGSRAASDPIPAAAPANREIPLLSASNRMPPANAAAELEPAVKTMIRLRAAAFGGDALAAWRAFQMTEFCETAERNRSALHDLPVALSTTLRATLEPEAEVDARFCEGITAPQLRERRAYLLIAADGGVPGAAAEWFDLGPSDRASDDDPADPEVKAWGEHALALLQRDAARGDLGALAALETVYQYGGIATANAAQALTYQLAVQDLMVSDAQKFAPAELDLQRDAAARIASLLSADQRVAAEAAAAELVARAH